MSDLSLSFDQDAALYERCRPNYPAELFADIFSYADLTAPAEILEVGCGSGQASLPFLAAGQLLTAVEPGKNLAALAREKFQSWPNFSLVNSSFENFSAPAASYDLLFAATSFHWIPEHIGYAKAKRLLKPNGCIALFWNRPFVAMPDDPLHQKIQAAYQKFRPGQAPLQQIEKEKYVQRKKMLGAHGFHDLRCKLYQRQRVLSADKYIALLNTYSDHRSMDNTSKNALEHDIHQAIAEFNNRLTIHDSIDLYLGRKTSRNP
jgi:ubiquinone/menaquinone biosynthesis C-methylase UbiE